MRLPFWAPSCLRTDSFSGVRLPVPNGQGDSHIPVIPAPFLRTYPIPMGDYFRLDRDLRQESQGMLNCFSHELTAFLSGKRKVLLARSDLSVSSR
jgi:hypothetical protein